MTRAARYANGIKFIEGLTAQFIFGRQISSEEVEKWLEELSQYLEQQEQQEAAVGRHHGFPASRRTKQRMDWMRYPPTNRKRNAELINNLLGLPRMMKVVG